METTREITVLQAAAITASSIIGVGVLPLGLFAARAGNSGAPMVTVIAILIAMFGLIIITLLGKRFPDKSFVLSGERIIGKWPARVFSLLIFGFFALITAHGAREFGEVVVTSVLRKTPLEVTVIVMLLLAALSSRHDMRTFSYIHMFYLPNILLPAVIIVVLSLKNADVLNLLPVFGNRPTHMINGALTIAALFQGGFVMTMVIPSMLRPEKAMAASLLGLFVSGGLYLMIVIATTAVFGAEEVKKLLWPLLELAKTTALPANVLERTDALFLAVWVTAVFTTLFTSYSLTVQGCCELLRLKDHRVFTYFFLPFVFILAMLPRSIVQLYEIIQIAGQIGLGITVVYPLLLLVVSVLRRIREDKA